MNWWICTWDSWKHAMTGKTPSMYIKIQSRNSQRLMLFYAVCQQQWQTEYFPCQMHWGTLRRKNYLQVCLRYTQRRSWIGKKQAGTCILTYLSLYSCRVFQLSQCLRGCIPCTHNAGIKKGKRHSDHAHFCMDVHGMRCPDEAVLPRLNKPLGFPKN